MKVRVEQLNPTVGDINGNTALILDALERAEKQQVELLILPEMVVTGYPPQDLLESERFRQYGYKANQKIIERTRETALLFGTFTKNPSPAGRKIFNSGILCAGGKAVGQVNKSLLPTYDVFDDLRYFEPGKKLEPLSFKGLDLGVTICEDIWYNENEVQYHHYDIDVAAELKARGAQVIVNISASPYTKTKHQNRLRMLQGHAKTLDLPLFYSNQTGVQTEIVFDGDSLVMDREGRVIAVTAPFEPGYVDVDWHPAAGTVEPLQPLADVESGKYPRILKAIRLGIRDYLQKSGVSGKVVLGLSGGVDSALVAVLATEALGAENVVALTMPGEFSSAGSIEDSKKLANNLGIELSRIPIHEIYETFGHALNPLFRGTEFNVAEENLQSRIRGALLMAYSNKFGAMLLATGNKSELSVGYATLYGDMNGGLNPVGDLYKTEVFGFCDWLNEEFYGKELIPREILEKPPSAELRPGQKDTDSLPEYEVLDEILWRYLELQQDAGKIVSEGGHAVEVVKKTLQMVDANEFKRFQAPPILKLSSKSFGTGRRWPLVQGWTGHYSCRINPTVRG